MKKRLRKKKHVGEFAEHFASVSVLCVDGTDRNKLFEDLYKKADDIGLVIGVSFWSGGSGIKFGLEIGRRSEMMWNLQAILDWLKCRSEVSSAEVLMIGDIYHPKEIGESFLLFGI